MPTVIMRSVSVETTPTNMIQATSFMAWMVRGARSVRNVQASMIMTGKMNSSTRHAPSSTIARTPDHAHSRCTG